MAADTRPPPPQRASGSSFYTAMRIMPKAQREAMYRDLFVLPRGSTILRTRAGRATSGSISLTRWRADIDALYTGSARCLARRPARRRSQTFELRREDFQAVIDGMEMDVVADIRAPDLGNARSLLRPRRERGRTAFGAHVRHGREGRASRLPTISAARCN